MLPVAARWHPPETGQSSASLPNFCTLAPSLLTSASSVVLISAHTFPGESPAIIPSSASITAALASGLGKQVIIMSVVSAICLGDSPNFAPFSKKGLAISLFRSRTVKSKPLRKRLPANLPPTLPSPINPIFMMFLVVLCQDFNSTPVESFQSNNSSVRFLSCS